MRVSARAPSAPVLRAAMITPRRNGPGGGGLLERGAHLPENLGLAERRATRGPQQTRNRCAPRRALAARATRPRPLMPRQPSCAPTSAAHTLRRRRAPAPASRSPCDCRWTSTNASSSASASAACKADECFGSERDRERARPGRASRWLKRECPQCRHAAERPRRRGSAPAPARWNTRPGAGSPGSLTWRSMAGYAPSGSRAIRKTTELLSVELLRWGGLMMPSRMAT